MTSWSSLPSVLRVGAVQKVYTGRGIAFEIELEHRGLHKHRLIRSSDTQVLQSKANAQIAAWSAQWEARVVREARVEATTRTRMAAALDREAKREHIEACKSEAAQRTEEAQALLDVVRGALAATVGKDDALSWSALERRVLFPTPAPTPRSRPTPPTPTPVRPPPMRSAAVYQPTLGFLDKLLPSRRAVREQEARDRFAAATRAWEEAMRATERADKTEHERWEATCRSLDAADAADRKAWETAKAAHEAEDHARRVAVSDFKRRYFSVEPAAVEEYCDLVLSQSEYGDFMPKEWELEFVAETGVVALNYVLPAPDALPTLTDVRYTQSTDSFSEKHLTEPHRAKLYDDFVYQVTLRTIHELFEADQIEAIKAVGFNGIVTAVDRSSGNEVTNCIVSVQASREPFLAINLGKVEPKQCFRSLKGVGSSALHSITGVPPIVTLSRQDARFVASRDVTATLTEGFNLATMPWEDFEHLIRQVFEAEFSGAGGEVKVTQASRDGGVDAVVFDPDPIRGGKMVIQAKRYANTVGVSAVRDLYGTLMNEGANKGILVTTSDYGPDAYDFAKGKPLTLLNGGNLLHLLQRHGLKAHIDLAEARLEAARRSVSSSRM